MSRLRRSFDWLKAHSRPVLLGLGAVALVAAAGFAFPRIWNDRVEDRGVVAEWNDAIARLGIDPVFPPEEDIYVGDLLAVITIDRRPDKSRAGDQPLLNRAIKIAHIDMRRELEETYQMVPTFPDTVRRPDTESEPWVQPKSDDLFAPMTKRPYLAIAAFPGFTIRHERAGGGGFSAWGAGLFGASVQESDLVEVKIPFAETYGVPSVIAAGKLSQFCSDPFTESICSDRTLRRHLGYVTGGIEHKAIEPSTGKPYYLVDVELALVNRVYLTRSIEQTRTRGKAKAAMVESIAPEPEPAEEASTGTAAPAASGDELERRLEAILDRLDTSVPGGSASVGSDSDARYELKQTFQRPVVIGYRAVRSAFPVDLDEPLLQAPTPEFAPATDPSTSPVAEIQ